jgi:hypothetical protein
MWVAVFGAFTPTEQLTANLVHSFEIASCLLHKLLDFA